MKSVQNDYSFTYKETFYIKQLTLDVVVADCCVSADSRSQGIDERALTEDSRSTIWGQDTTVVASSEAVLRAAQMSRRSTTKLGQSARVECLAECPQVEYSLVHPRPLQVATRARRQLSADHRARALVLVLANRI